MGGALERADKKKMLGINLRRGEERGEERMEGRGWRGEKRRRENGGERRGDVR